MLSKIKFVSILSFFLLLAVFCAESRAAQGLPEFTELAGQASSAVVNVSTVTRAKGNESMRRFFEGSPFGPPFGPFEQFEDFFGEKRVPRDRSSLGSGFIISKDGYIVTNNHVVENADEIKIVLNGGGKTYEAELVGRDSETDLALLKIEVDRELPVLKFGDSDKVKVGEWVMAIGNPFGLEHTVTAGIISAKGRIIGSGPYDNFLQTDASINPGNSGGPLLNMEGEVIGINTAIVASGQGIGFAIPSNMAESVIEQLKTHQKVSRGWLGVTIQNIDEDMARAVGLPVTKGALVNQVLDGQPAERAGIKDGDVVLSVNGQVIEDANHLTRLIGQMSPGDTAKIQVWRNGKTRTVTVELGERGVHTAQREEKAPGPDVEESRFGLSLRPVTADEARALGLASLQGLLVTGVERGSLADQNDINRGDVILEVNQKPVGSIEDFTRILETEGKKRGVILMLIRRGEDNLFRTIPLD